MLIEGLLLLTALVRLNSDLKLLNFFSCNTWLASHPYQTCLAWLAESLVVYFSCYPPHLKCSQFSYTMPVQLISMYDYWKILSH